MIAVAEPVSMLGWKYRYLEKPPSRCCEELAEWKNTSGIEGCHLSDATGEHGERSMEHEYPPWG